MDLGLVRGAMLAAWATLLGCGAERPPDAPATPTAAPSPKPCDGATLLACLAERRGSCEDSEVRRVAGGGEGPTFTTGPGGLIRVDHFGGQFYGGGGDQWLACFATCPGGAAERICYPVVIELDVERIAALSQPAEAAACSAFELPEGYQVFGDPAAIASLERVAAEPSAKLAAATGELNTELMKTAIAEAKADLLPEFGRRYAERCQNEGHDIADPAALEACIAAIPETEQPFRLAVSRKHAELLSEHRQQLDALTESLLLAPLCTHFASL